MQPKSAYDSFRPIIVRHISLAYQIGSAKIGRFLCKTLTTHVLFFYSGA